MSVEDLEVVDLVSMGPDGRWFLTITDDLDWAQSVAHQQKLQKKLNRYMSFIESGQIYKIHPAAKGKELVIDIRFLHMPDEDTWKFLERVRSIVERVGVQIQCGLLKGSLN